MIDLIWWLVDLFRAFLNLVNSIVLFNFNGTNITLLGFLGAFIILGAILSLLLPKIKS